MSYLIKDEHGHTRFTEFVSKKYLHIPVEHRDAILMDMLGEMKFGCGKTRWGSPILFTHIDSPVKIDSFTEKSLECTIFASAFIKTPSSTTIKSPSTNSSLCISTHSPLRSTLHRGCEISFNLSKAFLLLFS